MVGRHGLMGLFEKRSSVLTALAFSVFVLLGVEMAIFIASASSAGESSIIEVKDRQGHVVYHTPGSAIAHIDRWYFERKYGNLDNYDIEIKRVNKPFPVRAWVSASVGIPVVLMLLISYLVKVYLTLLYDNEVPSSETIPVVYRKVHPFTSLAMFLSSHSIFYLGAIIGIMSLTFWMVPNFLADLLNTSVSVMRESKWLVLGPVAFLTVLAVWVAYLRYRLSQRMMDHQFNLEKYRLDRELELRNRWPAEIPETRNRELKA